MYISDMNTKLGRGVLAISRPVGDSCPRSCPLHPAHGDIAGGQRCYMRRIEAMRPAAREAAERNMTADVQQLTWALYVAATNDRLVRLHPGGDFWDDATARLDRDYLDTLVAALSALAEQGLHPRVLAYTHCYDRELVAALASFSPAFQLYASVHDADDVAAAQAAGLTLLAFTLAIPMRLWPQQAWTAQDGVRALVCPEQRGMLPDCQSCGYCWRPDRGHVAFLDHTGPREQQRAQLVWAQRRQGGKGAA